MQRKTSHSKNLSFAILKHLLPGIRELWLKLGIATTCLIGGVLLRLIEPWPLQMVLDSILDQREPPKFLQPWIEFSCEVSGWSFAKALLAFCAIVLVMVAVVRAFSDYFRTILFTLIGNHVLSDLRVKLFRHIQTLSLDFHQRSRGGDLTIRLTGDINMLKDVTISAALPMLSSSFLLAGMASVMLWLNWKLGLIVLATFPIFAVIAYRSSRQIHQSARKQRKREGALASSVAESMAAVRSLQAHGAQQVSTHAFSEQNKKSHSESSKTSRLTAGLERAVDVQIALVTAIVLWFGTLMVLEGVLTAGELVIYLTYLKRGFRPLQDFAKYLGRLSKAFAAGERISEILEERPTVVDRPDSKLAPTISGQIRFESVTFGFRRSREDTLHGNEGETYRSILHRFDLTIQAGERVAIVGPSGIGKSTLLGLLLRLRDPDEGRILVDGTDIREWTLQSYRDQLGVILQENSIFATSVRDNIALAAPKATFEQIKTAAKVASAHDFIQQLPEGYNTQLGERGVDLSQGQLQRLAIARAALKNPAILLLDEPTSNLDPENCRRVMSALKSASEGRTTLIVTHDLTLASSCDKVLYLGKNHHCEYGSHADLVRSGGSYANLWDHPGTTPHQPLFEELLPDVVG